MNDDDILSCIGKVLSWIMVCCIIVLLFGSLIVRQDNFKRSAITAGVGYYATNGVGDTIFLWRTNSEYAIKP